MQLKPESKIKKGKIGQFIAHAALTLVCVTTNVAQAKKNSGEQSGNYFSKKYSLVQDWAKWSGEVGLLGYSETGGRVQAFEPAVSLNAEFEGEKVWSLKLVYDALTGASPNGALASGQPQTFTSPSGKASYQVPAGEIPLYDQFKDSRVNVTSSWSQPIARLLKTSAGVNFSKEYDYLSLGLNASLTKETESKNTSFSLGLAYTADTIDSVGGNPIPLAAMANVGSPQPKTSASENKSTLDVLFGVSQIMSRSWIVQANLSLGISNGYMNDPYKFVTIFDDNPGLTLGDPQSYLYEARPDSRMKQSIYLASKNYTKYGILSVSYRYYTDDWGINSHTLESSINFKIAEKWRLQPGFRYYTQTAADFFRYGIGSSEVLPTSVTADTRLGEMSAITPSLKIIKKLEGEKEISLLLQYYLQTGDSSPPSAVGSQVGQDLFPDLNAFIAQLIYSF